MAVLSVIWRCRIFFFFFSSRRRHTRCSRDWSSDVCSSDLFQRQALGGHDLLAHQVGDRHLGGRDEEIGRASWRGRGEISGVAGSLKKKKKSTRGESMIFADISYHLSKRNMCSSINLICTLC